MISLLPCPFCGHVIEDLADALHPTGAGWRVDDGLRHYLPRNDPRSRHGDVWTVACTGDKKECAASIFGDSREDVINKWNTRA